MYSLSYSGDILGVKSHLTWEWTVDKPLRSVIFPFLSSGIPFTLLTVVRQFLGSNDATLRQLITPSNMLALPRLWMTVQSLLIDFFIYKTAKRAFKGDPQVAWTAVTLFASSYTTIVFCTRTFSNATETLLFAALLRMTIPKAVDKEECSSSCTSTMWKNFFVSLVLVAGLFTRITFVMFAFIPTFMWVVNFKRKTSADHDGSHSYLPPLITFCSRCFHLGVFCVSWAALFVLYDTAYHNPTHFLKFAGLREPQDYLEWLGNLTLTPLNNIVYNLNVENLQEHGLHSRYTHAFLNFPMLFGPLVFLLLRSHYRDEPEQESSSTPNLFLLYAALFYPLVMLSLVPHQEPRFILPLIVPLVLVVAERFRQPTYFTLFTVTWIVFNVVGFYAWGLIHQGGVLPSINYLHALVQAEESSYGSLLDGRYGTPCSITFVYHRTYMPPRHLTDLSQLTDSPHRVRPCQVNVVDLAGGSYSLFESSIRTALRKSDVYVVVPATMACENRERLHARFNTQLLFEYFPHFTGEDPPWADTVDCATAAAAPSSTGAAPPKDKKKRLKTAYDYLKLFKLHIYHVKKPLGERMYDSVVEIVSPPSPDAVQQRQQQLNAALV